MAELSARGSFDPVLLDRLRAITAEHHTLHDIAEWIAEAEDGPAFVTVVDQDEVTNDLVIRVAEDVYLVYDCS